MMDILRLMNNKYSLIKNGCSDNSATNSDQLFQNNNSVILTQRAFRIINGSAHTPL